MSYLATLFKITSAPELALVGDVRRKAVSGVGAMGEMVHVTLVFC